MPEAPHSSHSPESSPSATKQKKINVELRAGPAAPSHARTIVKDILEAEGYPKAIDIACLLASEVVTNAVLYAGEPVGFEAEIAGTKLTVRVSDSDSDHPIQRDPEPLATNGRGVSMVAKLAESWGVQATNDGKVVWFQLKLA